MHTFAVMVIISETDPVTAELARLAIEERGEPRIARSLHPERASAEAEAADLAALRPDLQPTVERLSA